MSCLEADHVQPNATGQKISPIFPDLITGSIAQNSLSAKNRSYKKKRRYHLKSIIAKENRIGPNGRYKVCPKFFNESIPEYPCIENICSKSFHVITGEFHQNNHR